MAKYELFNYSGKKKPNSFLPENELVLQSLLFWLGANPDD